jgi:imidazolonepropionase-like amidohydrolase
VGEDLTGDEVIDLTGYTLMPGLIDSHVHVASSSGYNIDLLETWAQHGITSVREEGMLSTLGEEDYVDLIEGANADPQSAYLVATGKYLDVTGGYGMGPTGNMGVVITTPEEAADEIELKAALGYPQVKVGINSDDSRMTAEEFQAIIDTAHANGMTVAAHVNYADYLEELVGYDLDESAHTPSDEMSGALIDGMVQAGVAMNTSGAESYEDVKIQNLQAFSQAGGIITVGTDLMRGYDGCMESLVSEMAVLAKAGLSVQQVIACATHNNAQALGLNTGDIAVGCEADLVAVQGTVDDTFAALNDISFVMNDGVVIAG